MISQVYSPDTCTDLSTWDQKKRITKRAKNEIAFWGANIHGLNERQLYAQATPLHMRARASSDASSLACGAHITVDGKLHVTHKNLFDEEIARSSTWRELDAVLHAVLSFTPLIRGKPLPGKLTIRRCQPSSKKGAGEPTYIT